MFNLFTIRDTCMGQFWNISGTLFSGMVSYRKDEMKSVWCCKIVTLKSQEMAELLIMPHYSNVQAECIYVVTWYVLTHNVKRRRRGPSCQTGGVGTRLSVLQDKTTGFFL
jgi:hypothetical protein